jgi:hypothetical protein
MVGFPMRRLGLVMEPEPGNAREVEGVLNPAGVRGPDGQFYLFPLLVAKAFRHEWHEFFLNRCALPGIDKSRPPWDKDRW